MSYQKTGSAAASMWAQAEKEQAVQNATRGDRKPFRFKIKPGQQVQITFLDGSLNGDGILEPARTYEEHNLQIKGRWGNFFACTNIGGPYQGCPICDSGNVPYIVGAFTVIQHTASTDSKGQVYEHQPLLFMAKQGTMPKLQLMASNRGGLAGCTFNVARSGDKSAAVGDAFDFVRKVDVKQLATKLAKHPKFSAMTGSILDWHKRGMWQGTHFDYAKVLPEWRSPEKLIEMGFGSPVGNGLANTDTSDSLDDLDL